MRGPESLGRPPCQTATARGEHDRSQGCPHLRPRRTYREPQQQGLQCDTGQSPSLHRDKDVPGILPPLSPTVTPSPSATLPTGPLVFSETLTHFRILPSSKPLHRPYLPPQGPPHSSGGCSTPSTLRPSVISLPGLPLSPCLPPALLGTGILPGWCVCCPPLTHSSVSSGTAATQSFKFTALPPGPGTALGTQQVLNKC